MIKFRLWVPGCDRHYQEMPVESLLWVKQLESEHKVRLVDDDRRELIAMRETADRGLAGETSVPLEMVFAIVERARQRP